MLRRNIGKIVVSGMLLIMLYGLLILCLLPAKPAQAAGVLTKTVTKMFPTKNRATGMLVGIHLVITDDDRPDLGPGEQVVINETISRQLESGGMSSAIATEIGEQAQKYIDDYKALRSKYDNATYDTRIGQINSALNL